LIPGGRVFAVQEVDVDADDRELVASFRRTR
jgi:hypothetical protein